MFTTTEQTTILWKFINASALKSAITGKVYKNWRPSKSSKEDIVVNSIVLEGSESVIQRGVANVNIHVPSVDSAEGIMPPDARFSELSEIAKPILKEFNGTNYNFWLEQSSQLKEEGKEAWYLNFRLRFKFHNTTINS